MITSADGRAAVQGRSVGLGHPDDRALLRGLRGARRRRARRRRDGAGRALRRTCSTPISAAARRRLRIARDRDARAAATCRGRSACSPSRTPRRASTRGRRFAVPTPWRRRSRSATARPRRRSCCATCTPATARASCCARAGRAAAGARRRGPARRAAAHRRAAAGRGRRARRRWPARRSTRRGGWSSRGTGAPATTPSCITVAAMKLRLRDRVVEFVPGRPLVMGIVNANPDSFSDARRLPTLDGQVEQALALVAGGGGPDRRRRRVRRDLQPTATPAEVEIERVVPLVERLAAEGVPRLGRHLQGRRSRRRRSTPARR